MQDRGSFKARSQLIAVVSGNTLEFYDFLSFTFFAVNVARVMFPVGQPGTGLLLTLMTGALGFFARPVGAVIFGLLGDRVGRRPTMLATFALMGFSALGLAVTPSYASIGIAAPLLVVTFRFLQGLAAGGDVGPTTAYLIESAHPERRGMIITCQLVAMRIGVLASGIVGHTLATSLTQAQLDAWGWRIAFGIGAAVVPLAFALRKRLDETLHLPEEGPHVAARLSIPAYAATLLGLLAFLVPASMGDFLFVYAVTWLKYAPAQGYVLTMSVATSQFILLLIGAWAGDRFGRRPVKIVLSVMALAAARPVFLWGIADGSLERLAAAGAVLSGIGAALAGVVYPAFVEVTPKRARSGLVGIGYGVIVAIAMGVTPVIMTRYIQTTGDLAGPSWAYLAGAILGLLSAVLAPETSPRHARRFPFDTAPQGV